MLAIDEQTVFELPVRQVWQGRSYRMMYHKRQDIYFTSLYYTKAASDFTCPGVLECYS